jgi:hypothetical protein
VAAATAFAAITVPSLSSSAIDDANAIYWACSAVFKAEYLLRIWLTPQHELRQDDTWIYRRR